MQNGIYYHLLKNTICYLNSVLLEIFCCAGDCSCEALKYIEKARKKKNVEELKHVVNVNILDEFDKVLTILD